MKGCVGVRLRTIDTRIIPDTTVGYVIDDHFTERRVGVDSGSSSHKRVLHSFQLQKQTPFRALVLLLVSVSQVTGLKDTKKKPLTFR